MGVYISNHINILTRTDYAETTVYSNGVVGYQCYLG